MCNDQYSESGAPIAPTRCKEYVELRKENARLRDALDEWVDIAESQSIYDEFGKRYTHSFMSAGEHMWILLGLSDPYIPAEDFHAAVEKYKASIGNALKEVG